VSRLIPLPVRCGMGARHAVAALLSLLSLLLLLPVPVSRALEFHAAQLQQHMQRQYGQPGQVALQSWLDMLTRSAHASTAQQLATINQFWNLTVMASSDDAAWGQLDYWATPLESLGRRMGDCEDYVISKYFSLRRLGVAEHKLRMIYVRARLGGVNSPDSVAHMVLGYYDSPSAEPLILDNLVGEIMPASQRPDLQPVFSFNAQGIYAQGAKPTPASRIARWRDLLTRMQKEGFQP
jgi:predicted transglutaminase-like cysteine proteinase